MKIILLFLHKNIPCLYSKEAPCGGESNEYPKHIFKGDIRKLSIIFHKIPTETKLLLGARFTVV